MGFAENMHGSYGKDIGRTGTMMDFFYSLRIDADAGSPDTNCVFDPKKGAEYGRFETGWFLTELLKSPLVTYHGTPNTDRILCGATFGQECPACDAYEHYKQVYADDKDNMPIKAMQQTLGLPFLSVRRQHQKHIHKAKYEVIPIYWFELRCTPYIEDLKSQYVELKTLDETYPISQYPYMIFAKERESIVVKGKIAKGKQLYAFKALNPTDPSQAIVYNHPLITRYFSGQQPYSRGWDAQYFEMIQYLFILRFKQYVNPQSHEVHNYEGEFDRAVQYYTSLKDHLPQPTTKLEGQPTAGMQFAGQSNPLNIPF